METNNRKKTDEILKARKKFIETFAETSKQIGNDRVYGEIIGILLFENKPLTAQKIADVTGYSKSHISNIVRRLRDDRIIKEKRKPGSRKNYYTLEDADKRMQDAIRDITNYSREIIEVINECIEMINDKEKIDHLKKSKKKHEILYRTMKFFETVDEDKMIKILDEYGIEGPSTK